MKDDKKDKPDPRGMRSLEELLAEFATEGPVELNDNEERLVDRITFEKRGERFGSFKEPKTEKRSDILMLSKDTSMNKARNARDRSGEVTIKKEIPFSNVVINAGPTEATESVS